jgi:hypothetical protein
MYIRIISKHSLLCYCRSRAIQSAIEAVFTGLECFHSGAKPIKYLHINVIFIEIWLYANRYLFMRLMYFACNYCGKNEV